jgi:ferrous iron transport protein A
MTALDLEILQSAEIQFLDSGILHNRLAEMGCVPGTRITKLYAAPGGDPIAFQIDDYILGLRKNEAAYIHIHTLPKAEMP